MLAWAAGMSPAQDAPVVEGPAQELPEDEGAPLVLPPTFHLVTYTRADFLEDRRRLTDRLVRATTEDQTTNSLLALADFYIAHAMAPEGRSILQGLPRHLAPGHAARRDAQDLALTLLDPHAPPLSPGAAALLRPDHASWPDQPLFLALEAIRRGDLIAAGAMLPLARDRLNRFSAPAREAVLPGLLEAAVEAGQWDIARAFAGEFASHAGLRDGSALHYLLGRTALVDADYLAAFDNFAAASDGQDLWAHRARMALIDLGRDTGTLTQQDIRTLLEQAWFLWQGDAHSARMLQDLSDLQLQMDDRVAALTTLGDLIVRYPDLPAAQLAKQQSRSLLADYYADGAAGQMPLSDFMEGHRRMAAAFRFQPGYDRQTELYADHFRALGATSVAAREYELTREYLAVGEDLGVLDAPAARLADLDLKRIETLVEGGQYAPAMEAIEQGLPVEDPARTDQLTALRARILAATGNSLEVLTTHMTEPSAVYLRIKGEALFAEGSWGAARASYQDLHDRFPRAVTAADTLNLILAAYRSGDVEGTRALVAANPDLSGHPLWAEIAAGLTLDQPDLVPLRAEAVETRVNSATSALDRLDILNRATN